MIPPVMETFLLSDPDISRKRMSASVLRRKMTGMFSVRADLTPDILLTLVLFWLSRITRPPHPARPAFSAFVANLQPPLKTSASLVSLAGGRERGAWSSVLWRLHREVWAAISSPEI